MGLNLGDCLRLSARHRPGAPCLVYGDVRLSYGEVDAAARRVAGLLHFAGIGPGDCVALILPNMPQFTIIYYGILYAGATVVPLNPMARPRELRHIIRDAQVRVVFAFQDMADAALSLLDNVPPLERVYVVEPGMTPATPARGHSFLQAFFQAEERAMQDRAPQDIAVIMYTAAQYGTPRGAMLSHFNLFQGAITTCIHTLKYFPEDIFLSVLPLFHGFGQTTMMNAVLMSGASMVFSPRFDAPALLDIIERERVTLMAVVPTMLHLIVTATREPRRLSSLRCTVAGGAKLNLDCARQFEELFGVPVLEGYGLTETSPVAAFNASVEMNRPGSVGLPVWGCDVAAVNEQGELLPPAVEGEIVVRGHNVFQGYLNDPAGSADTLRGGWLHTGDRGYLDADGYIFLTGLKKDMILRAGMNVYPREVEGVLELHPAVLLSAVVGVPDAVRGEDVKAFVVLREGHEATENELKAWCRESLSSYKCPRRIEFIDELPRLEGGQVDKAALRGKPATGAAASIRQKPRFSVASDWATEAGMGILEKINSPADVKRLSLSELEQLAEEVRRQLVVTVNRNGGHLASPLGVVDLTIALHYVYDVGEGKDQLIWDVGHQCYAHKLLTGRRDVFDTIRKKDGISGYPKISESEFDCFGTGHSSTSISAAAGMAAARDLQGKDNHVVALIGDGAMTAGMVFEALGHAGHLGLDMLVILNDNEMSISQNVGALSNYFSRLITAAPYKRAKEDVGSFVKKVIGTHLTQGVKRIERQVKGMITPGTLFQELGFNYVGPVDGHDLPLLIECLTNIKKMNGPILLHCRTEKGKGLREAELDPLKYHGISPMALKLDDEEGNALPSKEQQAKPAARSFTDAFVSAVLEAAEKDKRVVGITAAMPTGTGLSKLEERFPAQYFDVGICEQHAVTFAAGLATQGMKPICAIYSTFLQRGFDQLLHDVAIQNLPVVFAMDRAGLVGEDSPTQNGTFDISFLRCVPGLKIAAPRDELDTQAMVHWALEQSGPTALRYARGPASVIGNAAGRDITRGEILREGSDAVFLAVGPVLGACLEAAESLSAEGFSVGVADARHIKPLDAALLESLADRPIITVEENTLDGGFGAAVMEYFQLQDRLHALRILRLGIPDVFSEQATRGQQLEAHGLHPAGLANSARGFLAQQDSRSLAPVS